MLEKLKGLLTGHDSRNIALLVDGPNIIRKEMNIDLNEIKKKLSKKGNLKVCKMFLDQYASGKLVEAMANQGFEPIITTGDVDVTMAVDAMEQVFNPNIQIIALMTRDTDFMPVLLKAKELGKETIVVGAEPGFSNALKNTADTVIMAETR